jgi:hypothetical protein
MAYGPLRKWCDRREWLSKHAFATSQLFRFTSLLGAGDACQPCNCLPRLSGAQHARMGARQIAHNLSQRLQHRLPYTVPLGAVAAGYRR